MVGNVTVSDPRGGEFDQWSFSMRYKGTELLAFLEVRPDGQMAKLEFYEVGATDPRTGSVQVRPFTQLTGEEVDHYAEKMLAEIEKAKV